MRDEIGIVGMSPKNQGDKRVVLYVRCSTNETRQDIKNQLHPLREFANLMGYTVVKEYSDYARGGNSNRPGFQTMMTDVRKHKFDLILIWALDRFSRAGILNTLSYLEILKRHRVGLKSLQESWLDTSDSATAELLLSIMAWVAQQERKRLSERVKAGLRNAKNVGKRGKDKKPRRKSGYYLRWQREKGKLPDFRLEYGV